MEPTLPRDEHVTTVLVRVRNSDEEGLNRGHGRFSAMVASAAMVRE